MPLNSLSPEKVKEQATIDRAQDCVSRGVLKANLRAARLAASSHRGVGRQSNNERKAGPGRELCIITNYGEWLAEETPALN